MKYTETVRAAFDLAGTDKGSYHEYEHMYAMMFSFFAPDSILEIGVKRGASLAAWQMLFPEAKLSGLDILEADDLRNNKSFNYMIGDSTTFDMSSLPVYDVVIDDGDHTVEAQIKTFDNFKDKFKYFYVIEDINFVKDNEVDSSDPVKRLLDHIVNAGYRGVVSFPSYNKRKDTRALVVLSRSF